MALALALALALAHGTVGCSSEPVDTSGLAELDGYTDWYRLDTTGVLPGHGDTYRVIYVNDTAREYAHAGDYPNGSVIVKEVREIKSDQTAGDLRYVAIMRRLAAAPPGGELHGSRRIPGGWLFTIASDATAAETYSSSCWYTCHVQSPSYGPFFDYGR